MHGPLAARPPQALVSEAVQKAEDGARASFREENPPLCELEEGYETHIVQQLSEEERRANEEYDAEVRVRGVGAVPCVCDARAVSLFACLVVVCRRSTFLRGVALGRSILVYCRARNRLRSVH